MRKFSPQTFTHFFELNFFFVCFSIARHYEVKPYTQMMKKKKNTNAPKIVYYRYNRPVYGAPR